MSVGRWKPITCLVTDRRRLATAGAPFTEQLDALQNVLENAVAAGVDLIQVREPDLDARDLLMIAEMAVATARGSTCRVVINERADVALASQANGVHLRASSAEVRRVRNMGGDAWLVGRSAHSLDELAAAQSADYVVFGTVFETSSKPGVTPQGVAGLSGAVARTSRAVLAIGGVTLDNVASCAAAGASGVAGISLFTAQERNSAALKRVVDEVKRCFISLT